MKKIFHRLFLICSVWLLSYGFSFSQVIDSAEYFIDTDPGIGKGIPAAIPHGDSINGNLSVNTNGITSGFHNLFFRVK
ncbi:MAG: hypothetical protein ACHQHP_03340, partial [Bacteroidia bacterium]